MIRNLLYNCCALTHSLEWRLNVERLCRYPSAFNGRRVVLLKTGEGLAPPDEVRQAFSTLGDCEFVEVENDPVLHEVAGFVDGLAMLESNRSDETTFYAHTKGVKYVGMSPVHMRGVRRWRNRMYDELLADPARIETVLDEAWCVGCFRLPGVIKPLSDRCGWHFAGTFWWVRHDALFSHAWRDLDRSSRYATESYLGELFPIERGVCLYGEHPGNLYDTNCTFACPCGHSFQTTTSTHGHPVKICPKCFKRKAVFVDDSDSP